VKYGVKCSVKNGVKCSVKNGVKYGVKPHEDRVNFRRAIPEPRAHHHRRGLWLL
jgi:hypothetical protein